MFAATSSKESPIALAIGNTRPMEPANASGGILPSLTALMKMSVARSALRTFSP